MQLPDTVEIETQGDEPRDGPGNNVTGSVIWLHGLGADGHDFEPIVPELNLPHDLRLRFVFPHAPMRPVTINGGMSMRAWFDIVSFDSEGRADSEGIHESSMMLEGFITREIERGVDVGRIVVAGFSQGGAIAIQTMLRTQHRIGGLMALSTYLALPDEVQNAAARKDLPIFMAHGSFDNVLPMQWGRASADKLIAAGFVVDWHEYPMAHAVCPQEIAAISEWMSKIYA